MRFATSIQVRKACNRIGYCNPKILIDVIICADHEGQFTYWSQRTNARTVNKGLRLDYFLCSHDLFPHEDSDRGDSIENNEECKSDDMKQSLEVLDSTILHRDTLGCSDHCPILLTFKIW